MTLPGAGPPTAAERALAALKSQSVNTARGEVQTRSSRRRPPTEPYHAPASGPLLAFARYDDPNTSTATSYVVDPSDLGDSEGDPAPYFAYNNSGVYPGVQMLSLGWYQVFVHVQVYPITAGSLVHVQIHWPSAGYDTDGYGTADLVGCSVSATTLPSKNYDTTGLITVHIDNPGGGTINNVSVHVLKLTDGI